MSSQNMVSGPDEDEHYEVRELGHPNKSFRNMQGKTGSQLHAPDSRTAEIINEEHTRALLAVGASMEGNGSIGARLQPQPVRPQLAVLASSASAAAAAAAAAANAGASMLEQVRASKNQAIDILRVLDAETMLEYSLAEYIQDVEASYNEADPKITFPKLRAAWTREEDRLLMVGVRVYGPNTESWPRIAMLVPGRTNKSCRKRWFHSLDPSLHKGPWTSEEDDLLRQRVAQFPSQWSRVAEGIPGRTDDQCAKRWRESLDPEIDRSKWRPEEDRLLLEKYSELGTQWQKIATFFQGRPGLHCRNRWRKIYRVISQKDKKKGSSKDYAGDLASVTESVNRRKTAQRSRPQGKGSASTTPASLRASANPETFGPPELQPGPSAGMESQAMFPFSSLDVSPGISGSSSGTIGFEQTQLHSNSQEHMYAAMPPFALSTSMIGSSSSSNIPSFPEDPAAAAAANFPAYMQHATVGVNAPQLMSPPQNSQKVGSPEIMGALYMPSAEQGAPPANASEGSLRTASALRQQAAGGVKRTSSVMYSPTDEQRQRLQKLKLKLYGCAAAPESCEAAFADSMSLNSHLKIVHPSVAAHIPSLSIQGGAAAVSVSADSLSSSMDTGDSMALTSAVGGFGKDAVKAYRCAMPNCGHTYKNVNGLEYHIFQSRKAKDHFVRDAGASVSSNGRAGSEAVTPDAARDSASPAMDAQRSDLAEVHGASNGGPSVPGVGAAASQLQCTEVDCLAIFGSELELRQHMISHHPRPIRRAMKPSHKAKSRTSVYGGNTPLEASASNVFWGSASIGDVLSASGMDAASGSNISAMPVIPEGEISTAASNNATTAAFVAAMGYRPDQRGPVAQTTPLFSPIQQPALPSHRLHSHMVMPALPPQAQSFIQGTSAPFMSAPALISETGGEPTNANSYFTLGMNRQQQQQQHQLDTFTPFLINSLSSGSSAMPAPSVMAPGQPRRTMTSYGNLAQHGVTPPRIIHPDGSSTMGPHMFAQGTRDSFQLEMELMQSMLSPFYVPQGAADGMQPDGDGDVQMGQDTAGRVTRSQRSDSVDLTSLATVPVNAGSRQPSSSNIVESPVMAPVGLSKSGTHSQMATAVMSRLGREKAAVISGQSAAQASQQNLTLSPWAKDLSAQDLSALGLLPVGGDGSGRNSLNESISPPTQQQQQQKQKMYTPQPADLAQFQPPQLAAHNSQLASSFHVDQHPSTSLVNCPAHGCAQTFSDANTLKHHIHFDHPRDEAVLTGHYSNPSSPMVEGFLSTLPHNQRSMFMGSTAGPLSVGALSQQQQQQQHILGSAGPATVSSDRAKAPHWVDQSAWSSWIAAANGQGNVTAAAAATAMGITPGISGVPQSYAQLQSSSSSSAAPLFNAQGVASENELLRMFESITKHSPVNQTSSS